MNMIHDWHKKREAIVQVYLASHYEGRSSAAQTGVSPGTYSLEFLKRMLGPEFLDAAIKDGRIVPIAESTS